MTIVSFLFLMLFSSTDTVDFVALRNLYYKAAESKKAADKFYEVMKGHKDSTDPLVIGFEAMAHLTQAKHSNNPYTKLTGFNRGKSLLDKAIAKAPENVELRFMRFCVQTNAPKFLGYSAQIHPDKTVILKGWSQVADRDLKSRIKNYMLETNFCTTKEKAVFK